jgi:hypothetical protein
MESDISVFEDGEEKGEWRVEYFDVDGACYLTVFAGPGAEKRARDYGEALKTGILKLVKVGPGLN